MTHPRIQSYDLQPGSRLGAHYKVVELLGEGWEGEVYKVVEAATGIERAAKIYFPQRNPNGRTLLRYARKLNRLKDVDIVLQYHHRDVAPINGRTVDFMVSDYVDGEMLSAFVQRHPGRRLPSFEALHVLHAVATGVAQIHRKGEYHGDVHSDNIIIRRKGIGFEVKLLDFFDLGRPSRKRIQVDVVDLAKLLHEIIGGVRWYSRAGPEVKSVVCGLKHSVIRSHFLDADTLVDHLESLDWQEEGG